MLIFAPMIPDNLNNLSLEAQFRIMFCHIMESLDLSPCDIYRDTKHHYNFIRKTINQNVDHKIGTADYLAEKLGYKLFFLWIPKSKLKNENEYKKLLQLLRDGFNNEPEKF